MNIEDLTIGEARKLAALFNGAQVAAPQVDPLVGQYVICRCSAAGVHAGELVSQTGDVALLRNSRRLWQWVARDGVALSGVAQHGLKSGKMDAVNPLIRLTGVAETIQCSAAAKESINAA